MKRYILRVLVALVLATPALVLAQTVVYTPDFPTVFKNPERGFHNRYEIINDPNVNPYLSTNGDNPGGLGYFTPDSIDRTFSRAKTNGDTLIHSYIHLDLFQTGALPQEFLTNLNSGLAAIRAAGLKIVLRPAYAWEDSTDVPEGVTIPQIDQLNSVISNNADVVIRLEAGWLGAWGEWHDSQYTAYDDTGQAQTRYRIIKEILNTTPPTIPVAIRYPIFNHEMFYEAACYLPSNTVPFTQSDKDRLGFHDDCFLATETYAGTYDQDSWLGFYDIGLKESWVTNAVTSYGGNISVGGESCDSTGEDDLMCSNVQAQMAIQHFTEINEDYCVVNTTIWSNTIVPASGNDPTELCFTRLLRKLGYRLRLIDATFPNSIAAGAGFTFSADLSNDGYAGVIRSHPIYLVFNNGTNRFNLPMTNVDVRSWLSGPVKLAPQTVPLPANMPAGPYTLALWLPDYYTNLQSRPEYSIRLANLGTWDPTNGYNVLSISNAVQVLPPQLVGPPPTGPIAIAGGSVHANGFSFTINSTTNLPMVVEVSTSLSDPNWTPISTNTLVGGAASFTDPAWSNSPNRFYRVLGQAAPLPTTTNVIPDTMVQIPGGSFMMGDNLDGEADAPTNAVLVSTVYMDAYDVTEALWNQVYTWALTHGYSFDDTGAAYPMGTNYPVNTVNWYDSVKWCNARSEMEGRVPAYYTSDAQTNVYRTGQVDVDNGAVNWYAGYRLPTEAEWEKAARGGSSGLRFPWGNVITITNANYNGEAGFCVYDLGPYVYPSDFYDTGSPVGSFPANGYGLYDMAGDQWQWCWDWYGDYPAGSVSDPQGPATGQVRVIRGGSYNDYAYSCRVFNRNYFLPIWSYFWGFRTVLTPGQP